MKEIKMKTKDLVGLSLLGLIALIFLKSCKTIPKSAAAVKPFQVENYLGKWYEIARFDYRFEKNLNNTTANYSLNSDGTIKVENGGYNYRKGIWKKATGKAKFVGSSNEAKLKVSFFGPFYAGYNVVALDDNYTYALVAGKNLNYLWLLSREKSIPENIKQSFLQKAKEIGYDTKKLVWVKQD
jgi:apolipoprotein D and lipocalin family protein